MSSLAPCPPSSLHFLTFSLLAPRTYGAPFPPFLVPRSRSSLLARLPSSLLPRITTPTENYPSKFKNGRTLVPTEADRRPCTEFLTRCTEFVTISSVQLSSSQSPAVTIILSGMNFFPAPGRAKGILVFLDVGGRRR